jgi:hypothetical protein
MFTTDMMVYDDELMQHEKCRAQNVVAAVVAFLTRLGLNTGLHGSRYLLIMGERGGLSLGKGESRKMIRIRRLSCSRTVSTRIVV